MSEEEKTLKLWSDIDSLGYKHDHLKSLTLALLLDSNGARSYDTLYKFLSDTKDGYIDGAKLLN